MHCPKCNHVMGRVKYGEVTVDRCVNCRGLWFDHLEMEQLRGLRGSAVIDSGRAKTGRSFDTLKDINCPRCAKPMAKVRPEGGKRFTYETCSRCHGAFLDAGEFRELQDKQSLLSFLKKLF